MPFLDDLAKATAMFQQSAQGLATQRAFQQATEVTQQIKAMEGDEIKKRAQLQQVAGALTMHLAGVGASPEQISLAAKVTGPAPLPGTQELLAQGVLLGDEKSLKKALAMQEAEFRPEALKQQQKIQGEKEIETLKAMLNQQTELLKLKFQPGKPLSDELLGKLAAIDSQAVTLTDLASKVIKNPELVGPIEGRIPGRGLLNAEFADFEAQLGRNFDTYRHAVTGAGAGLAEIKLIERNQPLITDPPEVFKRKVATIIRVGKAVKGKQLRIQQKAGRDVSGFSSDIAEGEAAEKNQPLPGVGEWITERPVPFSGIKISE